MLRDKLIEKGNQKEPEFRWRSDKVTRLEGFSDAVLAFAMTLLVVSLEVPKTFDQLMVAMRGFIAFAICFVFLVGIWYSTTLISAAMESLHPTRFVLIQFSCS